MADTLPSRPNGMASKRARPCAVRSSPVQQGSRGVVAFHPPGGDLASALLCSREADWETTGRRPHQSASKRLCFPLVTSRSGQEEPVIEHRS
jgi:hypothetical protein